MIYEELKQKKVIQDQTMESIKGQLLVSMLLGVCTPNYLTADRQLLC